MEAPINYGCATVCNAETKTEGFLITLQYQAENRKYEDLELTLKSAENVLVTFDATHNLMVSQMRTKVFLFVKPYLLRYQLSLNVCLQPGMYKLPGKLSKKRNM